MNATLRRLLLIALPLCAALGAAPARAQVAERCALPAVIEYKDWKFSIRADADEPKWAATRTAADLYQQQERMFTPKTRAFVNRGKIPASMGLFEPNVEWSVEEARDYSRLIDGRYCARVTGLVLVAHAKPVVQLSKELQARNCVSRAAFNHQLFHNEILRDGLKELQGPEAVERFKKLLYPVYGAQGLAGKDMPSIDKSSKVVAKKVGAIADGVFDPFLLAERKRRAENFEVLSKLHQSCSAEFGKAANAALGIPPSTGQEDDEEGSGH